MKKKMILRAVLACALILPGLVGVWPSAAPAAYGVSRDREVLLEETPSGREDRELGFPELAGLLESHLVKNLPDKSLKVEIRDIRVSEPIWVPAGRLSCKVWISEPLRRGGSVWANLVFYRQGQEVKRWQVNVLVDVYQAVVVAKRYLKRHQEIREEDIDLVLLNLKGLPPDAVSDPKTIVGKRTIVNVKGQDPIRAGLLEVPPLVKKGDLVQVIVDKNNIRVSCQGEIKETGRRGDRVKLVNLSSKKELMGRVVDGGTVQLDGN
ncbi:MAG: flagellar basal body P-ring formation protein FlgA [Deltaproteobacteria bacterium]|nr:flagellar basal body P-ring formation protein FlgA [Deltaproteobacteria bacterium]